MTVGSATPLSDVVSAEALELPPSGSARIALGREPDAVVAPGSVEEVVELLAWAHAAAVGVIAVGTGAHLRDRRPELPYIVLSAARLSGVEMYEPADLTLTAGAGTPLAELAGVAGEHRQWLPFDPMDVPNRTLGGLAVAGVTGPLWALYGHVRNHVLGMTVVCGDGRTLRLGGRVVKNVAGFDLIKPMVGSRGRLAVVTSVTVRLFPVPVVDRVLVLEAAEPAALVPAARAVATAPTLPASIVLSFSTGAASLLVRLHGAEDTVDADQRMLEAHAGVSFASREGPEAEALLATTRDAGADAEVLLHACTLPSELGALLDLIRGTLVGVDSVVVADVAEGSARVAFSGVAPSDVVQAVRAGAEALGGTVAVDRCPIDASPAALSTPLSPAAREIGDGLKRLFDPGGVLL
ncbi:MAG: FAD-binding protein [Gemmatimonadetes bacterium]|nr:FAD-binding protein [Gemmatimonadota bacterium]